MVVVVVLEDVVLCGEMLIGFGYEYVYIWDSRLLWVKNL